MVVWFTKSCKHVKPPTSRTSVFAVISYFIPNIFQLCPNYIPIIIIISELSPNYLYIYIYIYPNSPTIPCCWLKTSSCHGFHCWTSSAAWLLAARRIRRLLGWNDEFVQRLGPSQIPVGHGIGPGFRTTVDRWWEKMAARPEKGGVFECFECFEWMKFFPPNVGVSRYPIFQTSQDLFLWWNHNFGTKDVNSAQILPASPKQDRETGALLAKRSHLLMGFEPLWPGNPDFWSWQIPFLATYSVDPHPLPLILNSSLGSLVLYWTDAEQIVQFTQRCRIQFATTATGPQVPWTILYFYFLWKASGIQRCWSEISYTSSRYLRVPITLHGSSQYSGLKAIHSSNCTPLKPLGLGGVSGFWGTFDPISEGVLWYGSLTYALEGGSSHKLSPNLFNWVHPV